MAWDDGARQSGEGHTDPATSVSRLLTCARAPAVGAGPSERPPSQSVLAVKSRLQLHASHEVKLLREL